MGARTGEKLKNSFGDCFENQILAICAADMPFFLHIEIDGQRDHQSQHKMKESVNVF